jgi:hypothetical protein
VNTLPSVVPAVYGAGKASGWFFQKPGVQPSRPGGVVVGGVVVGGVVVGDVVGEVVGDVVGEVVGDVVELDELDDVVGVG